jgi:coenzyme F420-reducing hydrogenase alpha subunit
VKHCTVTIDPVTRIEGRAKITIWLDDRGDVKDAHFSVFDLRMFEKFLEGRLVEEAPQIVTRICGICPVSHHLASAKACDMLFDVEPTETGTLIRELMHMGQYIHNHSLHFFFLAGPDFFAKGREQGLLALIREKPEVAKKAIQVRKLGQKIVEKTGGRAIHPVTALPGGVTKKLSKKEVDEMAADLSSVEKDLRELVNVCKEGLLDKKKLILNLDSQRSYYSSLLKNGDFNIYDGIIRMITPDGKIAEELSPNNYLTQIGEHVEPWTYLKFPFYKKVSWPDGAYRVGPLARLNVAERIPTPEANREFTEFKNEFGKPAHNTLLYNWARLIELYYAVERAKEIVEHERIAANDVRRPFKIRKGEGVGVIEAPRGTLIHHYAANDEGIIERANLIVATTQNNTHINRSVRDVAKRRIESGKIDEKVLNDIEVVVRAYDPCLSCSTHMSDQTNLEVAILNEYGERLKVLTR